MSNQFTAVLRTAASGTVVTALAAAATLLPVGVALASISGVTVTQDNQGLIIAPGASGTVSMTVDNSDSSVPVGTYLFVAPLDTTFSNTNVLVNGTSATDAGLTCTIGDGGSTMTCAGNGSAQLSAGTTTISAGIDVAADAATSESRSGVLLVQAPSGNNVSSGAFTILPAGASGA
jgi:hypothetical protein